MVVLPDCAHVHRQEPQFAYHASQKAHYETRSSLNIVFAIVYTGV